MSMPVPGRNRSEHAAGKVREQDNRSISQHQDDSSGFPPRISVVIPARNEAANLPHVLATLPTHVWEVILVDGHSVDDTIRVARMHYPAIRIVSQHGRGKGDALRCGFAACRGEIIVMLDADGSADAAEIDRFVAALDEADFAKGSRFIGSGGSSDLSPLRRLGNAMLTGVVNVLFRTRYTDLCYGYNAFRRSCLPYLHLDCDGFEVEAQMATRVARAGLRVREVGSFEHRRRYGRSNLHTFRDGWRVLRTVIAERFTPVHHVDGIALSDDRQRDEAEGVVA